MTKLFTLNNIAPTTNRKKKRIVGRGTGSGHGNMSGKGSKGQKARAGGKVRQGFEGGQTRLAIRLPKRGMMPEQVRERNFVITTDQLLLFSDAMGKSEKNISGKEIKEFFSSRSPRPVKIVLGKKLDSHKFNFDFVSVLCSSGAKEFLSNNNVQVAEK